MDKKRCSTERQRSAVRYCEHWLREKFTGNINSFAEVSKYLDKYLKLAKKVHENFETMMADKIIYRSAKKPKRG